ncbi:type II toxin-antitoxin system RelE/ParE family toxin [Nonomuraea sp. 10N515B]|uniref:type II toxin-antitoxin system RelE/ParE family toxin n=1 Tax=Nonomuraea sp. 10N515B TaxID=3457422 RepID=UPI003FCD0E2E
MREVLALRQSRRYVFVGGCDQPVNQIRRQRWIGGEPAQDVVHGDILRSLLSGVRRRCGGTLPLADADRLFLEELYETDRQTHRLVNQAILVLERNGPSEGRPLVDTIAGSKILFVFAPWRAAILLVAGDKAGNWERWYREAVPRAERLYEFYLVERHKEMDR